jgi:amylosucrase
MLGLYNVTDSWRSYPARLLETEGLSGGTDRISGSRIWPGADGKVWLPPYAAMWITGS